MVYYINGTYYENNEQKKRENVNSKWWLGISIL